MTDLSSPGLSGPTPGKRRRGRGRRGAPGGGEEGAPREDARGRPAHRAGLAVLTLGALGVVFGDIGTSPLYALKTAFSIEGHAVRPTEAAVYGVISLVVWALTIVVSLKYVTLVMRADNDGEGGIMALIAQIQEAWLPSRTAKVSLVALGIFGAALFYGDGMITPAISVLSAVEGLEVAAPGLEAFVVPITLAILTGLFAIQRFGTAAVGRLFGPVMALWFGSLALAGLAQVVQHPEVLRALSPTYALAFFAQHPGTAFIALGAVVLAVTGAEALYADMGHFGRPAIRRAWFLLAFPALTLNYMGQASLILDDPKAIRNPFFLLAPEWSRIALVVLATLATIIASQAVISGAFSVTRQAAQLGFVPRLNIKHTSRQEAGQVYVPAINWGIFAAVVALVVGFGSSDRLASAYGIAVTGTLAIDTVLFFIVVRVLWRRPLWLAVAGAVAFLVVDLAFLSANLTKVLHGGWFPLVIAVGIYAVLTSWRRGRDVVSRNRAKQEGPLREFIDDLHAADPPIIRVPGTAVFLSPSAETTPLAMRANVEHFRALHEHVVILSVKTIRTPHVPEDRRLTVDDLGYRDDGIWHLSACFGFQDRPDVPATLRLAQRLDVGEGLDVENASYFVSRVRIKQTGAPGMSRWRKKLFAVIARNAADAADYFCLPGDRTVAVGGQVDV